MRLNDNVAVDGRMWPKGCRPPERIAELIGEHAWEDGNPSVAAPPLPDDEQTPGTSGAGLPPVPEVDPATGGDGPGGDGESETQGVDPGPCAVGPDEAGWIDAGITVVANDGDTAEPVCTVSQVPAPPEPPRVGRGASKAAWAAYAEAIGAPIPAGEDLEKGPSLAEIQAAVDDFRAAE